MLEKGWIGGGNTGRNTTIIRSNYLFDESAALYDHALKLWEDLIAGAQLQRHVLAARRDDARAHRARRAGASSATSTPTALNGVDNEWLTPERGARRSARRSTSTPDIRYPVLGAALQRRGGTARHDAVAWGYARAADALGVDIIQNCEVTGIRRDGERRGRGVETTRGLIRTRRRSASSRPGTLERRHGAWRACALPLESFPLQALVSEPVKPVFPCVVMSNTIHAYISQSDKGELVIGAGTDAYISYTPARRAARRTCTRSRRSASCSRCFRRLRMLRNWGGIVDVTPDRSPIIGKTPVPGLYVNCGWGTGGFKATPGSGHVFAWTIAHGRAASDQRAVHARALPRPAG